MFIGFILGLLLGLFNSLLVWVFIDLIKSEFRFKSIRLLREEQKRKYQEQKKKHLELIIDEFGNFSLKILFKKDLIKELEDYDFKHKERKNKNNTIDVLNYYLLGIKELKKVNWDIDNDK